MPQVVEYFCPDGPTDHEWARHYEFCLSPTLGRWLGIRLGQSKGFTCLGGLRPLIRFLESPCSYITKPHPNTQMAASTKCNRCADFVGHKVRVLDDSSLLTLLPARKEGGVFPNAAEGFPFQSWVGRLPNIVALCPQSVRKASASIREWRNACC